MVLEYINSTSLIIFGLVYLLMWLLTRRPYGMPPGPPLIPFFGNALQLGSNIPMTYRKLRKQYGDIFSIYVSGKPMVVFNGLKVIKEAFVKRGDVFSDRAPNIFWDEINQDKGITFVSGKLWKEQRAFALKTLREFGMGKTVLESKINEEITAFIKEIESHRGQPFYFQEVVGKAITNIIYSIVFGLRFEYTNAMFKLYLNLMSENIINISFQGLVHVMPFLRHLPGDPFRFHRAIANQRRIENELIRPAIEEHKANTDDGAPCDFIAAYIKEMRRRQKEDNDTTMTGEVLVKVISDLFLAGSETTTTGLRWLVVIFVNFPEVQTRCYDEVQEQIGLNRFVSMKDKMYLPYVEATIMEMLRFCDIVPFAAPYKVSQDVEFGGYILPKDTVIGASFDSVLSDPEIWGDPENFRPERFLDGSNKVVKPEEFIPFGVGRRMCLGESLARMESFLFAVAMIQKFEFISAGVKPSLHGVLGLTHAPKAHKVIAKLRS